MVNTRRLMREGCALYHLFDLSHTGDIHTHILRDDSFLHQDLTHRLHYLASLEGLPSLHHVFPTSLGLTNAETETEIVP